MNSVVNTQNVQGFRLSPQQRRIWSLPQQNWAYGCQIAVRLEGQLKPECLSDALQRVIDQYEILRTAFKSVPGIKTPVQVIAESALLKLQTIDLRNKEMRERSTIFEEIFQSAGRRAFDYEEPSSLRATLLLCSPVEHILLLGLPGLCADAATMRNLLAALVSAYSASPSEQLADEPLQYADLAEWQNELLEGADTVAGRDFWRLKDYAALGRSRLPRLRGAEGDELLGFEPGIERVEVEVELVRRVAERAAAEGVEEAAYYFGCWQVLLWRLIGESPLICGLYCDGRADEELRPVLGPLAKVVPVDFRLAQDLSVGELIRQGRRRVQEARKWSDYFCWDRLNLREQVIETSALSSFGAPWPYCTVSFEEFDEHFVAEKDGLRFTLLKLEAYTEPFDVSLRLSRHAERELKLELHYDARQFSDEEMKLLAGRFTRIVQTSLEDPLRDVQVLDLLGTKEKHSLDEWNQTEVDYGKVSTLAEMFSAQVRLTPQAAAVAFEDRQLSYAEVNGRANRLAHYLRRRGIGPNVPVGLCVERSPEMIIGILGILKAGGAYVPLDPATPKTRIAYQLADVAAPLLITQESLLEILPDFLGEVCCIDRDQALFADELSTDPESVSEPQHLAYVIYTSGSTGAPKGVAVTHQNIFNYTNYFSERLRTITGRGDCALRFALVSTIAADLGNTCLFTSLASGGCLHIISYEVAIDGRRFAEYSARQEIDVLKIVPSHLNALLSSEENAGLLPRQCLILGGEPLSHALLERVKRLAPNCHVINHYGPTETTVGSLTFDTDASVGKLWRTSTVPIGRPIANTKVYVLNELLNRVPVGIAGELYIGGEGLAQGYLHQPAITSERFIPDPFSQNSHSRLYRTGDQARCLPDGNVEFLGRLDNQVKIKGFRVELGEIETAVRKHPRLKEAVVLVRDHASGEKRLVAYLVARSGETLSINELRQFLQNDLPEHMIPSAIVFLKDLPLTPNGKTDRLALPTPDWERPEQEGGFANPSNKVEAALAEVWSEILGIKRLGVHDNFFELGGDSINSIQIAAQAGRLGLRFAPTDIFRWPTIASLGLSVEASPAFGVEETIGAIHASMMPVELAQHEELRYPLSPAQEGILFHCLYSPNSGMYTSQLNYTLSGEFDPQAFVQAWQRIVDRHSIFRTAFIWEGLDNPVQVAFKQMPLPLKEYDWRELSSIEQEAKLKNLLEEDRLEDFNFSIGPLLRFALIRLREDAYQFVWTYHHLLMDGWSETIVLGELSALYRAFSRQQEIELEPALPFTNYIAWLQRQDLKGAELFWREKLAGFTAPTILKVASPPDTNAHAAGAQHIRLTEETTRAVTRAARENQLTLNTLAQGAWGYLLSYFSGDDDVVFGATVSGRPSDLPGVECMVGMFINTLPVRVQVVPDLRLLEWLKKLQQRQADMLRYEFSPLVQVQAWSDIPRGMSLFETILVFQNTPQGSKGQGPPEVERKIVISNVHFHEGKTNFALSVDIEPGAELSLNISYDRRRFDASFVTTLLESFEILLQTFASDQQIKLATLQETLDQALRQRRARQEKELERTGLQKLEQVRRRSVQAVATHSV